MTANNYYFLQFISTAIISTLLSSCYRKVFKCLPWPVNLKNKNLLVGMVTLDDSLLYGPQYRVRVASPEYTGHCISWDYPLLMANSSTIALQSGVLLSNDSSIYMLQDDYHKIIYFSGKSNSNCVI
jgi:hypothetical protein